ncbi:hypothetical protein GC170_19505 [bacterium]|nr:hypothetical protein [bacterium]
MPKSRSLHFACFLILSQVGWMTAEAANVAPTYRNVQEQLDRLTLKADPVIVSARAKLEADLRNVTNSRELDARLNAYATLQADAAQWAAWAGYDPVAADVANALNRWIEPRLRSVQYAISARDTIARGDYWLTDDHRRLYSEVAVPLVDALEDYEAATTAAQRFDSREKVRDLLAQARTRLQTTPWPDAQAILDTITSRWESPNMIVTVAAEGLRPMLDRGIVTPDPVFYKGRTSYVTPRERYGYGLIPSTDAISFYIRQAMTSVTPVTDFEQQVEANRGGRILTRAYALGNTIQNDSLLTMSFAIRPSGVAMAPSYQNNARPNLSVTPRQGGGITRAFMGMAGMDRQAIANQIYSRSIGQIQSETETSSLELGQMRANEAAAQLNGAIMPYRRGPNAFSYSKFLIDRVLTRTEPSHIHAEARLAYEFPGLDTIGPIDAVPPVDPVDARYVTTAIHIPNLLENIAANYLAELASRGPTTIGFMPDKDSDGVLEIEINGDDLHFRSALEENLRISKQPEGAAMTPGTPLAAITLGDRKIVPHFTVSDKGNLVMLLRDVRVDVASPALTLLSAGRFGSAIRIDAPSAEVEIEFVKIAATSDQPERLALKVLTVMLDPKAKIFTFEEPGKDPKEVSLLRKIGLVSAATAVMTSRPFDLPLDSLRLGDRVRVVSVDRLGALGWFQFVIDADQLLYEMAQPGATPPPSAPATVPTITNVPAATPAPTDIAVNPSAYVAGGPGYTCSVPAGCTYWVVPGTNPPRVEYDPNTVNPANGGAMVNITVQPGQ